MCRALVFVVSDSSIGIDIGKLLTINSQRASALARPVSSTEIRSADMFIPLSASPSDSPLSGREYFERPLRARTCSDSMKSFESPRPQSVNIANRYSSTFPSPFSHITPPRVNPMVHLSFQLIQKMLTCFDHDRRKRTTIQLASSKLRTVHQLLFNASNRNGNWRRRVDFTSLRTVPRQARRRYLLRTSSHQECSYPSTRTTRNVRKCCSILARINQVKIFSISVRRSSSLEELGVWFSDGYITFSIDHLRMMFVSEEDHCIFRCHFLAFCFWFARHCVSVCICLAFRILFV